MTEPLNATPKIAFDPKDVELNKNVAVLSYIWILFLVPLLGKKDSRFAQEHAKQGLVLFASWIVGGFIFWIPLFGWALAVALFVVTVLAIVKCLQGEFWEIPFLGPLRNKFNL
jgi:uncharacterized membrane protein